MTSTPQDALALTTAFAPRRGYRNSFATLTRIEAFRLARHPVLLVGTVLGVFGTTEALIRAAGPATDEAFALPDVASTVGVAALLSAYYLTRSSSRADELLEPSPTPTTN